MSRLTQWPNELNIYKIGFCSPFVERRMDVHRFVPINLHQSCASVKCAAMRINIQPPVVNRYRFARNKILRNDIDEFADEWTGGRCYESTFWQIVLATVQSIDIKLGWCVSQPHALTVPATQTQLFNLPMTFVHFLASINRIISYNSFSEGRPNGNKRKYESKFTFGHVKRFEPNMNRSMETTRTNSNNQWNDVMFEDGCSGVTSSDPF